MWLIGSLSLDKNISKTKAFLIGVGLDKKENFSATLNSILVLEKLGQNWIEFS